ncbi:MAG: flavin reductase family protein [Paucibacter sp.]|nr:flavin reductase family protein [Roseateles sp.]
MSAVAQRVIEPSVLYFGTPVALISSVNPDGGSNLSPISSVWALADRLVIGLGLEGQAIANLMRDGGCVVNLPNAELWPHVERLARATGRQAVPAGKAAMGYSHVADKFALAGLHRLRSELVNADRVSECPLQIEARLSQTPDMAAAEARGFAIVELTVLRVHAHATITHLDSHHIDTTRWQPLLYVFRHYCGTSAPQGANFRAETPLGQT